MKFIRESAEEFSRVSWPSRNQALIYTALTIVICIVFGIFFMGLDWGFGQLGIILS